MRRLPTIVIAIAILVILGWIGFLVYAEVSDAGGHEPSAHEAAPLNPSEATNGTVKLAVTIDPQAGATPADQVRFSATVTDLATGKPVTNVQYEVVHWHIEDEKVVFATRITAPDGQLNWAFDFFDGVPHEIRVTAAPTPGSSVQFQPITVQPVADLVAVQPPLRVKLQNTVYLVAIVGLGVVVGLFVADRRTRRPLVAHPGTHPA